MGSCEHCHAPLPDDSTRRRRFCSDAHRTAFWRDQEAAKKEAALDLLLRQGAAIRSGDLAALEAIAREAEEVLG